MQHVFNLGWILFGVIWVQSLLKSNLFHLVSQLRLILAHRNKVEQLSNVFAVSHDWNTVTIILFVVFQFSPVIYVVVENTVEREWNFVLDHLILTLILRLPYVLIDEENDIFALMFELIQPLLYLLDLILAALPLHNRQKPLQTLLSGQWVHHGASLHTFQKRILSFRELLKRAKKDALL